MDDRGRHRADTERGDMRADTKRAGQISFTLRGIVEDMNSPGLYKSHQLKGLGVRVTPAGTKSFVFDRKVNGKKVRMVIGPAPTTVNDRNAMTVPEAEAIVREYNAEADKGRDPRAIRIEKSTADAAKLAAEKAERDRATVTLADAWRAYVDANSPTWSEWHRMDAAKLTRRGGEARKRGGGKTVPGLLTPLMPVPLVQLDKDRVTAWAKKEGSTRATQARLARRWLFACLRWTLTDGQESWKSLVDADVLFSKSVAKPLGRAEPKKDRLEADHLPAWFEALTRCPNPVHRAFFAAVLLTGARRGEMALLRWDDIDFRWKRVTLRDKVEGARSVPLSPYLEHVIVALPRTGAYVFQARSKSGHIEAPSRSLSDLCADAQVPRVTVHGLRRSFATMAETAGLPAGAVAQIMGHKPSALAEKHYKHRTLSELADYAKTWETWLLDKAGVKFTPQTQSLRLVKANP